MIRVVDATDPSVLPYPGGESPFEARLNELLGKFSKPIQEKQLVLEVSRSGTETPVSEAFFAEVEQVLDSTIQCSRPKAELSIIAVGSTDGIELEISSSGSTFMENLPAHLATAHWTTAPSTADESTPAFRTEAVGCQSEPAKDSEVTRYCLACPQGGVAWTVVQRKTQQAAAATANFMDDVVSLQKRKAA